MTNQHAVTSLRRLRSHPRLHKIPPYISLLCILGGIFWLLLLPLNQYSRQTYISENALLPGQVHTYFAGSEQNVFRAYREELRSIRTESVDASLDHSTKDISTSGRDHATVDKIKTIFNSAGLPTATQHFDYRSAGNLTAGTNIYSVLHAPRGDGTEAIVLLAPQRNSVGEQNTNGIALLLTLARYFKSNSLLCPPPAQDADLRRVVSLVKGHNLSGHTRHGQRPTSLDLRLPFYARPLDS
jgi:GPI-anchor transamidase subunit GAA1